MSVTGGRSLSPGSQEPGDGEPAPRRRADARRNVVALIEAARAVFATTGMDAPAKEITDLAGVGVGTLYRHFPHRSDLVKAVVKSGIDAVADAGPALVAAHEPAEALIKWIHRFTELLATKRGLASALHSGDPAFEGLPGYFLQRSAPPLRYCSTQRWPTARFAMTSAPRISCTPSRSCASPSPGERPNTTSASSPSFSTDYAAAPRSSPPHADFGNRRTSMCYW